MNKQIYTFSDIITHIEFSPDNNYILVVHSNTATVEVKSFYDEKWMCKITDSLCGLLHAIWAPDSRTIITFSDFQVRKYTLKTFNHISTDESDSVQSDRQTVVSHQESKVHRQSSELYI